MAVAAGSGGRRARARRCNDEAGFTLIELLVVLLIIGILLAVAIPTFLSVTNSANDTAAQADLQTALTGAKTYYLQTNQTYVGLWNGLDSIDTGVSEVTSSTPAAGPHVVSFDVVNSASLVMTSLGNGSPNCWGIVELTASGTTVLGANGPLTMYFEEPEHNGGLTTPCQAGDFTGSGKPANVKTSVNGFGGL